MKKFYSFLFAAVALVGFAACNSDNTEEPAPAGVEKVSFKANIEETKTGLDAENKTTWCEGDVVMIEGFEFVCGDDLATFTCTQDNCTSLLNKEVTAVYSKNKDGEVDSTAGVHGAVLEATGTLTAEGGSFNFAVQNAFLKLTTTGTVTLKGAGLFYYPGIPSTDELEVDAGEHYVAINPATDVAFSYEVNGIVGKSKTITFEKKMIYNLGKLDTNTITTYLVPDNGNENFNFAWTVQGAWFAAYYYNGEEDYKWVKALDEDADGVYECSVVGTYAHVIFCRMNSEMVDNLSWDARWNQTNNLDVPTNGENYYYTTAWGDGNLTNGEWHEAGYDFYPTTLYLAPGPWVIDSAWFAIYLYNGENDNAWVKMADSDSDGIYEGTLPTDKKYANVIFCRMNNAFDTLSWDEGHVWNKSADLVMPEDDMKYTVTGWNLEEGSWSTK